MHQGFALLSQVVTAHHCSAVIAAHQVLPSSKPKTMDKRLNTADQMAIVVERLRNHPKSADAFWFIMGCFKSKANAEGHSHRDRMSREAAKAMIRAIELFLEEPLKTAPGKLPGYNERNQHPYFD